jgi:membrane protein
VARPLGGLARAFRALRQRLDAMRRGVHHTLWEVDERALPRARRLPLVVLRLAFVTVDSFFRERLQMRAAALAFFTVLSIVPLAAFTFSVAKGVGAYDALVRDTVRPFLDDTFRAGSGAEMPEGVAVLRDTVEKILEMVARTDVFGLGLAGLVVLVVTVSRVLRGAEESFDAIWGFPGQRPLHRRLPAWVVVALLTPLALVFASTVTAARQGQPVMALLYEWIRVPILVHTIAFVLPPLLVCLSLLPLYLAVPSALVRRRSAAIGALVGGLAWYGLQVLHVRFQIGVARQNALYSGFGAFPIFLLWLHLSWVCVLLGAQVAAAHQNAPTLRQLARRRLEDHLSRQAVALRAMMVLAHAPEGRRLRTLAREVGVAVEPLRKVLDALLEHALLTRREGPYDPLYVPTEDPEGMRVAAVVEALGRGADESPMPWEAAERPLTEVLEGLHSAAEASHHNRTIGELKRASERRPPPPAPGE